MGQETHTRQHSTSKQVNAVPVDGDLMGFDRPSTILLEQQPGSGLDAIELVGILPAQPTGTSVFTEALIRGFDIAGSVIMLVLAAPIMVIASIIIKVSSAGPVLYKQYRVGRYSRIFTLYKFRTMVNDAEKIWGFTPATQDDERVTPIGRFLRRTRLDEIPQLVNVLKGEMSLVGPRPENLYRVNMHASLRGPRLLVKPGLTGLAQIRAFYDLKPEHKIKYDYLYIQKRSFLLNVYIILMTVPVVLLRKGW
jgi:lipopolysaccharide/colanic/teichoic acid biosynthesis glycosyltransferase